MYTKSGVAVIQELQNDSGSRPPGLMRTTVSNRYLIQTRTTRYPIIRIHRAQTEAMGARTRTKTRRRKRTLVTFSTPARARSSAIGSRMRHRRAAGAWATRRTTPSGTAAPTTADGTISRKPTAVDSLTSSGSLDDDEWVDPTPIPARARPAAHHR